MLEYIFSLIFALACYYYISHLNQSITLRGKLNLIQWLGSPKPLLWCEKTGIPESSWKTVEELLDDEEVARRCTKTPLLKNSLICYQYGVAEKLLQSDFEMYEDKNLVLEAVLFGSPKVLSILLKGYHLDNRSFEFFFLSALERPCVLNPAGDISKILEILLEFADRRRISVAFQAACLDIALKHDYFPDLIAMLVRNILRSDRFKLTSIVTAAENFKLIYVSKILSAFEVFKALSLLSNRGYIFLPHELRNDITFKALNI